MENARQASRIDNALIANGLLDEVYDTFYMTGIKSDHSAMCVILELTKESRGPGYWKFNSSLLKNPDYLQEANTFLEAKIDSLKCMTPCAKWEKIKEDFRSFTKTYSQKKAKQNRTEINDLMLKVTEMEDSYDTLNEDTLTELREMKLDLDPENR